MTSTAPAPSAAVAFLDAVAPGLIPALTEILIPTFVEQVNLRDAKEPLTVEEVTGWLNVPAVKKTAARARTQSAAASGGAQCTYVFSRGEHKGEQCENTAKEGSDRCSNCARKGSKAPKAAKAAVSASAYVTGMTPRAPAARAPAFVSRSAPAPAAAEAKVAAQPAVRTVTRTAAPRPVSRAAAPEAKVEEVKADAKADTKAEGGAENGGDPEFEQLPDGRYVHAETGFVVAAPDRKSPVLGRETEDRKKIEPLTPEDRQEATKQGFVLPVDTAAKPRAPVTRAVFTRKPAPASAAEAAPGGPKADGEAAPAST